MEAKQFGQFIAEIRKEKNMTQTELAEQIHVTNKAVSRWERGLGFPDIKTLEPLAQALGISILELMRSEKQEQKKEQQTSEIQYTQREVSEMLKNAEDISTHQKKQDRNANIIAGILVAIVAVVAWTVKLASIGGALILGGLVATVFVSLWYFFQNIDEEESRKIYGFASVVSIGILLAVIAYVWGDRIYAFLPGSDNVHLQIFWTGWYLLLFVTLISGAFRSVRQQRQKKGKIGKTVIFVIAMTVILFMMLLQYYHTMENEMMSSGMWNSTQQYAETLLKKDKNLKDDWIIGNESWKKNADTYHIDLTYYADAKAEKEGHESEYQYVIRFDGTDGFKIESEGVPKK